MLTVNAKIRFALGDWAYNRIDSGSEYTLNNCGAMYIDGTTNCIMTNAHGSVLSAYENLWGGPTADGSPRNPYTEGIGNQYSTYRPYWILVPGALTNLEEGLTSIPSEETQNYLGLTCKNGYYSCSMGFNKGNTSMYHQLMYNSTSSDITINCVYLVIGYYLWAYKVLDTPIVAEANKYCTVTYSITHKYDFN